METPALSLDEAPLPPVEPIPENDTVDSMFPPHAAEYISAQHSLAQDRTALQRINEDIEAYRQRIAHARAQIRLLERQRDTVQHRVSIHRARLSPVRNIPDQVLQEIFQHCLPDESYIKPDVRSAPLLLTHVCRRWRAVAQDTSELWSSITLHDRGPWNYELEVQMVKQWLDRSRRRPIRMNLACSLAHFGHNIDASCSDIFQLAIAHSSQLRDLHLEVTRPYLYHFMSRASLPALESITLSIHSIHPIEEFVEPSTPAFTFAPTLRRVAFHGNAASVSSIPRTVFPQITHLFLDCDTTLDFALLFQDFPSLQCLTLVLSLSRHTLRFRFGLLRSFCDGNRFVAPSSLRHLEIRLDKDMLDFGDPERLERLFDPLALPGLRTLRIAAPLRSRYNAETERMETSWANHAEWVRGPAVVALLGRSRFTRPRCECVDLECPECPEVWVPEV